MSDFHNLKFIKNGNEYNYYPEIDKSMSQSGKAPDSKIVGQLINGLPEVSLASQMINTSSAYLYKGSENGYSINHWYYYDDSDEQWMDGGLYNLVIDSTPTQGSTNAVSSGGVYEVIHDTDVTLTQPGQAADAKVVGDEIEWIKQSLKVNDIYYIGKANLESGGYSRDEGQIVTRKRLRLTEAIYVKKGTYIKFLLDGWYYHVWELSTSDLTGGNTLYATEWITTDTYEVQYDCYIYIAFATASTEALSTVITVEDFGSRLVSFAPIKSISESVEILTDSLVEQYVPTIQQGSINSTGEEISSQKSVRTDWIPSGELLNVYCDATTYIYRAFLYSVDKVYINKTGWQSTQGTKTADDLIGNNVGVAYIRLHVSGSNNELMNAEDFDQYGVVINCERQIIGVLQKEIGDAENEINILNSVVFADALPAYWQTYMATKLPIVQSKIENSALSGDSFAFITDYHYDPARVNVSNAGYSHLLLKLITEKSSLRMLIFGGDAINGNAEKSVALEQMRIVSERMRLTGCDVFGLRGNHEYNLNDGGSVEQMISESEIYSLLVKTSERQLTLSGLGLDYYIDNVNQKIRYICMDSKYERTGRSAPIISDEQIIWMQNRMTELDASWSIVVLTHELFAGNPNPGSEVISVGYNVSGQKIHDGVVAILNTLNATLIAVICGHVHYDYSTNSYGFWEVAVTTDSKQEKGQWSRNTGDYSEQAFDVFSIDKTNRKLFATRIGRGIDREWNY